MRPEQPTQRPGRRGATRTGARTVTLLAQESAPRPRPGESGIQAVQVPQQGLQPVALAQHAFDVTRVLLDDLVAVGRRPAGVDELTVQLRQQVRLLVGLPAEHHAVEPRQPLPHLRNRLDATVQHDREVGMFLLQTPRHLVAQRRNLAVLLRTQALQVRLARMDDEHVDASVPHH